MTTFLYGLPDAETLFRDPAEVIEYEKDQTPDDDLPRTLEIEQYTVCPPRSHLPSVPQLLELVDDWTADHAEITGEWHDDLKAALPDDAVRAAADNLLDLIAGHLTYLMADKHIATHTVVIEEDGKVSYANTQAVTRTGGPYGDEWSGPFPCLIAPEGANDGG